VGNQINTVEAFQSFHMSLYPLHLFAGRPEGREKLERYGIDTSILFPEIAESISIDEFITILKYYAKVGNYRPAQQKLIEIRKQQKM
jgi:hypothetical protein